LSSHDAVSRRGFAASNVALHDEIIGTPLEELTDPGYRRALGFLDRASENGVAPVEHNDSVGYFTDGIEFVRDNHERDPE
jgi:hypothetical protein